MFVFLSLTLAVCTGVALHRAYQEDAALNTFADALLIVSRFPLQLLQALLNRARETAKPPNPATNHRKKDPAELTS
jgi:hypothetical protein